MKNIAAMFLNFFFKKKVKQLKTGDVVKVKKPFFSKYPMVSKNSLLTVEQIQSGNAVVIFMNDLGNNIYRETIPVTALAKIG